MRLCLTDCLKKWNLAPVEELKGGSDRIFMRVRKGNTSCILLVDPSPAIFQYLEIQRLLSSAGIGVPEIYSVDLGKRCILMEDLGDLSLKEFVLQSDIDETIRLYRRVLELLARMQRELSGTIENVFDLSKLIGEIRYFEEKFLGYYGIELNEDQREELKTFSKMLYEKCPYGFMHRDFQSRNIYLKNNEIKLIDFQSAHEGPIMYDVASLIQDPYVFLPREVREDLARYYLSLCRIENGWNLFWVASLQRLMQALAAYVKLSKVKGKKGFAKYIMPGMAVLKEAVEVLDIDWMVCILDAISSRMHS